MHLVAPLNGVMQFLNSQHCLRGPFVLHEDVVLALLRDEDVRDLPVSREELVDLLDVGLYMKGDTFSKPWTKIRGPTTYRGGISTAFALGFFFALGFIIIILTSLSNNHLNKN